MTTILHPCKDKQPLLVNIIQFLICIFFKVILCGHVSKHNVRNKQATPPMLERDGRSIEGLKCGPQQFQRAVQWQGILAHQCQKMLVLLFFLQHIAMCTEEVGGQ